MSVSHTPTETTRSVVAALSAYGISQDSIMHTLGVMFNVTIGDRKTLRKHYKKELNAKNEYFKGIILASIMRGVMKGNPQLTIFAGKTILGLRETINLDLNNPIPNFDLMATDPTGEIIEGEYVEIPERPLLG